MSDILLTRPRPPWADDNGPQTAPERPVSPFAKVRQPVDADNDGWVYDNTPRKRIAPIKLPGNKAKGPGNKPLSGASAQGETKPKKVNPQKLAAESRAKVKAAQKAPTKKAPAKKKAAAKKPPKKAPEAAPEAEVSQPEAKPEGLPSVWSLKSGYVGAQVIAKTPSGKDVKVNVIGKDEDDLRKEFDLMRREGYKLEEINPPVRDINETPVTGRGPAHPDFEAGGEAERIGAGTRADIESRPLQVSPAPKKPAEAPQTTHGEGPKEEALEGQNFVDPKDAKQAALDHFRQGGKVGDMPNNADILAAIADNPTRFKQLAGDVGGTAGSAGYTDEDDDTGIEVELPNGRKTTKRVFFVKKDKYRKGEQINIDHLGNETLGNEFLKAMGFRVNDVRIAHDGKNDYVVNTHIGQHQKMRAGDVITSGDEAEGFSLPFTDQEEPLQGTHSVREQQEHLFKNRTYQKWGELLKESKDPGQWLRLGLMDFVMLNQDRHNMNWQTLWRSDGDVEVLPIDHGVIGNGGLDRTANMTNDPGFPSAVNDLEEWVNLLPDLNFAGQFLGIGTYVLDNDRARVRREVDKVINQMDKLDWDGLRGSIVDAGLSEIETERALQNIDEMEVRVDWMAHNPGKIMEILLK